MRACIEHVAAGRVDGWAYNDDAPNERLLMQLVLDGNVVAEARAQNYREDLKRNDLGDGCYGYEFADVPHADLPLAYLAGRIEVRATRGDAAKVMADPAFYLREETEGFLRVKVLESSDLAGFLAWMKSTPASDAEIAGQSLNVLNASRAHFEHWQASDEFLTLGVELARRAGRRHSEAFYADQLRRVVNNEAASAAGEPARAPVLPATYGTLTEWVEAAPAVHLEFVEPQFFSGSRRPSFLQEAGFFAEEAPPEAPRVPVLAFREDAFGGAGWWVKRGDAFVPVARNLYYLEFELLRSVLDEGGFVVIDMSNEGPWAEPHWIALLNKAIVELGIPRRQVILINQNLRFGAASAEQQFLGHVAIGHYFVSQSLNVLKRQLPDEARVAARCNDILAARKATPDDALKHYLCLNFTPRWFRWATVLHLSSSGLLERGLVSFPGPTNFKLPVALDLERVMPELHRRRELLDHVRALLERCPLELDLHGATTTSPDFDFPLDLMTRSLVHIVTESEMSDGMHMLRFTEKVLKPIVGLQPFLVAGNPRTLALLKSMGFRTFERLFDERYDAIYDPVRRLDTVFDQIDRVAAMPIGALRAAVEELQETLVHNFVHLMLMGPLMFNRAVANRLRRLIVAQRAG